MTTKVVQWATGITGRLALRAVIESDNLELVGVRVYDPVKVGADAGEIAGTGRTGILATDSKADILAVKPDIVLYMGGVERHPETSIDDIVDILSSGANVVTTGSSLLDVRVYDSEWASRIEAACGEGNSTLLGLGIYPGFWGEAIVPLLARLSFKSDAITVRESLDYSEYASKEMLIDVMGYGKPADYESPNSGSPTSRPSPFGAVAVIIAKALGWTVDSVETYRETAITDREIEAAVGKISAGTVGAIKLGVRARCGAQTIQVEHVTWLADDVKPDWSGRQGYEIEFDGAPTMRCQLLLGTNGEDHTDMGCLATAMHAVHAIPSVISAQAGILDLADIPAFVGNPAPAEAMT